MLASPLVADLRVPFIPDNDFIEISLARHCDSFFGLPLIIATFIERANNELKGTGHHVRPWTINRAVSVFYKNEPVIIIDYDAIEDDIVWWLDRVQQLIKEKT